VSVGEAIFAFTLALGWLVLAAVAVRAIMRRRP
jgi:hypothetical protein